MSGADILYMLSGSIACYKSCQVISRLVQQGHRVQTACTAGALRFIGPATLEGLTGRSVLVDPFEPGHMGDHIQVARRCQLAILAPASAHTINRLAHGLASDMVGTLFLAYERPKPFLLAPAMNEAMLLHPATQESLARLASWGVQVLPSDRGMQACGTVGEGRLLEPEQLLQRIEEAMEARPLAP